MGPKREPNVKGVHQTQGAKPAIASALQTLARGFSPRPRFVQVASALQILGTLQVFNLRTALLTLMFGCGFLFPLSSSHFIYVASCGSSTTEGASDVSPSHFFTCLLHVPRLCCVGWFLFVLGCVCFCCFCVWFGVLYVRQAPF